MAEHHPLLPTPPSSSRSSLSQPKDHNILNFQVPIAPSALYEDHADPRRWWILVCTCLFLLFATLKSYSYYFLGTVAIQYLNIDEGKLLLLQDVSTTVAFIFSGIVSWYLQKRLRRTLLICFFIATLSAWIQYCFSSDFIGVLISQGLIGVMTPLFSSGAVIISYRWFPANQRLLATTIIMSPMPLGIIICQILALWIDNVDYIPNYNLCLAILTSIPLIMGIFCIPEKYVTPPSYSALITASNENSLWQEIKKLFEKPHYVRFWIAFGVLLATTNSQVPAVYLMFRTIDLPKVYQAIGGVGNMLFGVIVSNFGSIYLSRNKRYNYDNLIRVLYSIALVITIVMGAGALLFGNQFPLGYMIIFALSGVGFTGVIPFPYNSFAESTFPIQESVSSNSLFILYGLVSVLINRILVLPALSNVVLLVFAGFMLPSWIYTMFYLQTDYKRYKVDQAHSEIEPEDIETLNNLKQE